MNTVISLITPEAFTVSQWSGGVTTQIAIFPPDAQYANHDFLWRISSATVNLPESDFTPLPDYKRYISLLDGRILLTHDGGRPVILTPGEIHCFDGGAATKSQGTCVDFNLMLRKGKCDGTLSCLKMPTAGEYPLISPEKLDVVTETQTAVLYCVQGSGIIRAGGQAVSFSCGEAVQIQAFAPSITLCCNEPAVFMVAFIHSC
ncbi:HutD/Ves family protein [Oscillospiraceae bacterium LTW-04]|nr:HutD family protein [Oscillospiraceae bacterium MB24-C1]